MYHYEIIITNQEEVVLDEELVLENYYYAVDRVEELLNREIKPTAKNQLMTGTFKVELYGPGYLHTWAWYFEQGKEKAVGFKDTFLC